MTPGTWTVEITAADGYAVEGLTAGELTWENHAFTVLQPYRKYCSSAPPSNRLRGAAGPMAVGRRVAPAADGAGDDGVFRPLRRATGALPLDPAIFEKIE